MRNLLRPLLFGAGMLAAVGSASASVLIYSAHPVTNIPDASGSGIVSTLHVQESQPISLVSLVLDLVVPSGETGFTGDLYVYLQHGSSQSVLLNRPGRSAASSSGYGDNVRVSVTFNDAAVNGDIHNYRMTLNGSDLLPLSSTLTGAWQPDGRAVDPSLVRQSDPRTASLGVFNGSNSAGDWSLFAADVSGGGVYRLEGWTLSMEVAPVPEPELAAFFSGLALFAYSLGRKLRSKP